VISWPACEGPVSCHPFSAHAAVRLHAGLCLNRRQGSEHRSLKAAPRSGRHLGLRGCQPTHTVPGGRSYIRHNPLLQAGGCCGGAASFGHAHHRFHGSAMTTETLDPPFLDVVLLLRLLMYCTLYVQRTVSAAVSVCAAVSVGLRLVPSYHSSSAITARTLPPPVKFLAA
jgi:hypothetical protein